MFKQIIQLAQQPSDTLLLETLAHINIYKMVDRIREAIANPTVDTKCILFEYNWTTPRDVSNGLPSLVTVTADGEAIHCALQRGNILVKLQKMFDNPNIIVYARRKWNNGVEDRHTYQVVLLIRACAFLPPPTPIGPRSQTAETVSSHEWTPYN